MFRRRRGGFILLFGARNIVSGNSAPPLRTTCPNCHQPTELFARTYRQWFTLFFLPVFPISGKREFSECSRCHAQFPYTLDQIRRGLAQSEAKQNEQAIALYNSLRASPSNAITLNQLMLMYAGMNEFAQAISAAREFPDALNASEQCMATLGRVYLASEDRPAAIEWFDKALARNPMLGEAHYYKAVAHLTATPPDYDQAVASARAARNAGHPQADELLREAQAKQSGQ